MKKVAVLGTFLESNKYSAIVTENRFRKLYGSEIIDDVESETPKTLKEGLGFFSKMNEIGSWEPVPIALILGGAGGPADGDFISQQFAEIQNRLSKYDGVDGVYILNHGAMTTTSDNDPDGTLYQCVREIVGAETPIVTTVDLHANITERMVSSADIIVSYRTDPHVDQFERGEEAAELLLEMMLGMKPATSHIRVPIVPPNVSLLTADGPYGDLIDFGQAQVREEIANISVVGGFAYSDTNENGLHIIVTTRNDQSLANSLCKQMAHMAWDMRERFLWDLMPVADAISLAVKSALDHQERPLLLADLGDNIGAGGPGNTLTLLREALKANIENILFGSFFDRTLVEQAYNAGEGSVIDALFHGDDWESIDQILEIKDMAVSKLHPGVFPITTGPLKGMSVNAGKICLLQKGNLSVLVTSHRPLVWPDPLLLEELGFDLNSIRTLVLKCRSSYRAVYEKYFDTDRMIEVDTPGRTSPVLTRHNWEHIERPAYPIDQDFTWHVPELIES